MEFQVNQEKANLTPDPYLLRTESESAGRVLASLESGSDEVNYHAPLVDDRIDGSMRALGVAILMAAVICVLVAIAAFAGWVPWAV
jgi:hypothetical protein